MTRSFMLNAATIARLNEPRAELLRRAAAIDPDRARELAAEYPPITSLKLTIAPYSASPEGSP